MTGRCPWSGGRRCREVRARPRAPGLRKRNSVQNHGEGRADPQSVRSGLPSRKGRWGADVTGQMGGGWGDTRLQELCRKQAGDQGWGQHLDLREKCQGQGSACCLDAASVSSWLRASLHPQPQTGLGPKGGLRRASPGAEWQSGAGRGRQGREPSRAFYSPAGGKSC